MATAKFTKAHLRTLVRRSLSEPKFVAKLNKDPQGALEEFVPDPPKGLVSQIKKIKFSAFKAGGKGKDPGC
jgi:hypothetical protein